MFALLFRLVVVSVAGLVGLAVGFGVGGIGAYFRAGSESADYPFLAEYAPLPHHVPEHKGGLSFRFAMAHDVIHERFPKHGPDHYRERNRLTRAALEELAPDDPAAFPLADDLGAGLDRLGKPGEAAAILRDKLARQKAAGLGVRDLYTSYANLGTFISHESYPKALAGDADARKRFREGLGFVRKSVQVNPEAHFGRERWQVVVGEFLLAAMERPDLLKTFDFLGNRLDLGIQAILTRDPSSSKAYGRPNSRSFNPSDLAHVFSMSLEQVDLEDASRWAKFELIRHSITKVGAEDGWADVPVPSHREPVPFDGPVLGIIGIWRQSSGANPHFALALGETMLRVGQRYIAWAAFERASRMAARFSPDPTTRQFLLDHCRRRQTQIEETLSFQAPKSSRAVPWQYVSPAPEKEAVAGLRASFEEELAYGEGYQRAYREYEARRIAAGVPIADEKFFDAFLAGREPIASPVGTEDSFAYVSQSKMHQYAARVARPTAWAWGVFGAGVAAMATAMVFRWKDGRAAGRSGLNADFHEGKIPHTTAAEPASFAEIR